MILLKKVLSGHTHTANVLGKMSKITQTLRKPFSLVVGFALVLALISAWTLQQVFAATGSIYITPGSNSVQVGNNVTVSLRINPGAEVNGVIATVNFDKTKLQYVTLSSAGSPFNTQLAHTGESAANANGVISLEYGALPINGSSGKVSADSLIETITFKALASSGSASLTITNANSYLVSDSSPANPSVSGATVNFTAAPAPTCPTGQVGTPPNCKTPTPTTPTTPTTPKPSTTTPTKPTNTTTPTKPVTPAAPAATQTGSKPEITGATPAIQYTKGTLQVSSSTPTTAYIKYGFDKTSLPLTTPVSPLATSHLLALDFGSGSAGQTFYYAVVITDANGNQSQTEVEAVKTKGIPVKITVVDKDKKPLKNKTVTLHSDPITVKTDSNGVASINDAAPGNHTLRYTSGGKVYSQPVVIADNVQTEGEVQSAAVQSFSVTYDFAQPSSPWIAYVGGLVLLAILAGGAFLIISRRNNSLPKSSFSGASVVTQEQVQSSTANQPVVSNPEEAKQKQLSRVQYPKVPSPGNVVQPNPSDNEKESK